MEGILGQNRLEDVSWLCSLSESELDMLISLKSIVLQRARMIGHEELANNFDLKMLRALGFVCLRYFLGVVALRFAAWIALPSFSMDMLISLKSIVLQRARMIGHEELANNFDLKMLRALAFVLMECIRDKVKDLTLAESAAFMESCNLLKYNLGDIMSLEEIRACIGINSRKGPIKRRPHKETTINQKKQKSETSKS